MFSSMYYYYLLVFQVKIQKESEVRLKIIGTRVDATEIVSHLLHLSFISSPETKRKVIFLQFSIITSN